MNCSKCNTSNPETNKFCSQCGAPLDPSSCAIDEYVCRQVESTLKTLAKERSFVELEVVETISNKLMGRAKRFAYFVGIPIGLLSIILVIFGIKSIYDISIVSSVVETAKELKPIVDDLSKQYKQINKKVEDIERNILFESPIEKKAKDNLIDFIKYLEKVGFKTKENTLTYLKVKVDNREPENVRYDHRENRIYLGETIQNDYDLIFREYVMYALVTSLENAHINRESLDYNYGAIESGLEDYFPCSYSDNPKLGVIAAEFCQERYGKQFRRENHLRDLENKHKFGDLPHATIYQYGGIWAAAFWEMRKLSGKENSDKLLFASWNEFIEVLKSKEYSPANCPFMFVRIILKKDKELNKGKYNAKIKEIFEARGLKIS